MWVQMAHGSGDSGCFSLSEPPPHPPLFFFFSHISMHVSVCTHTHPGVGGSLWELVSFHRVGPRDGTRGQGWHQAPSSSEPLCTPGRRGACPPEHPPSLWPRVCNVSCKPSSMWARGPVPGQMPTSGKPSATVSGQGKRWGQGAEGGRASQPSASRRADGLGPKP